MICLKVGSRETLWLDMDGGRSASMPLDLLSEGMIRFPFAVSSYAIASRDQQAWKCRV